MGSVAMVMFWGGGVVCFFNTTLNLESFIKSAGFDLLFILCQNVM